MSSTQDRRRQRYRDQAMPYVAVPDRLVPTMQATTRYLRTLREEAWLLDVDRTNLFRAECSGVPGPILKSLWLAGYQSRAVIESTGNMELLHIRGIGVGKLDVLRQYIPYAGLQDAVVEPQRWRDMSATLARMAADARQAADTLDRLAAEYALLFDQPLDTP